MDGAVILAWFGPAASAADRILPIEVDSAAADHRFELRQGVGWLHVPHVGVAGAARPVDLELVGATEDLELQAAPIPGRLALDGVVRTDVIAGAELYSAYYRGLVADLDGELSVRVELLHHPRYGTVVALRALGAAGRGRELHPSAVVAEVQAEPDAVATELQRGSVLELLLARRSTVEAGLGAAVDQPVGPIGLRASVTATRGSAATEAWADGATDRQVAAYTTLGGGVAADLTFERVPIGVLAELYSRVDGGEGIETEEPARLAHRLSSGLGVLWVGRDDDVQIGLLATWLLPTTAAAKGTLVTGQVRFAYTPG